VAVAIRIAGNSLHVNIFVTFADFSQLDRPPMFYSAVVSGYKIRLGTEKKKGLIGYASVWHSCVSYIRFVAED
jgi:hypothetical protein